jgi:3',5'-nucleoside bisphosphate phosphatase
MIPPLIVQECIEKGVNLIAITDHNASANFIAVQKAAEGTNLTVLPGMELQTREEVHVLCLFDTLEQIQKWQKYVDASMPGFKNRPDFFGEQFVVDETGEFIRNEENLLSTSSHLTLKEAGESVQAIGGLFIPAHVNRKSNSLIANLGLIPVDVHFDALEISRHIKPEDARKSFPQISAFPLIQDGDAHYLEEIFGYNEFIMDIPTIAELLLAFSGEKGRQFQLLSPK